MFHCFVALKLIYLGLTSTKRHVYKKTIKTELNKAQLIEAAVGAWWNIFQVSRNSNNPWFIVLQYIWHVLAVSLPWSSSTLIWYQLNSTFMKNR